MEKNRGYFKIPHDVLEPLLNRLGHNNRSLGSHHEPSAEDLEHTDDPYTRPIDRIPQDQEITLWEAPELCYPDEPVSQHTPPYEPK
jgi:hypothetical protein